jgi:GntR family transcriptional regulator
MARLRIHPNSPLPIFEQIIQQVRAGVARGRLKPGDQIPTVRELATDLLVNPNTVAKAYQIMEQNGILATRRGAGTFIAEPNCTLSNEERARILTERIDACLTEAVHLRVPRESVRERFERAMKKFEWPEGS